MTKLCKKIETDPKRALCDRIYRAVSRNESPGCGDLLAALRICSSWPADNHSGVLDPVLLQLDTILGAAIALWQRDHGSSAA